MICSDGLDRGDPEVLDRAMSQLDRLCHRIVWVNPHRGNDRDRPLTSMAMLVAEPYINDVQSGHNLASLEEFARALPALR